MGKIKQEQVEEMYPTPEQETAMQVALDTLMEMSSPHEILSFIKALEHGLPVVDLLPSLLREAEQTSLSYLILNKLKAGALIAMRDTEIELMASQDSELN